MCASFMIKYIPILPQSIHKFRVGRHKRYWLLHQHHNNMCVTIKQIHGLKIRYDHLCKLKYYLKIIIEFLLNNLTQTSITSYNFFKMDKNNLKIYLWMYNL